VTPSKLLAGWTVLSSPLDEHEKEKGVDMHTRCVTSIKGLTFQLSVKMHSGRGLAVASVPVGIYAVSTDPVPQ